jgi:hypothetical protein
MKYLLVPALILLSSIPVQAEKSLCRMGTKNPIIHVVGNFIHNDVPKCAKDKPVQRLNYRYGESILRNTDIWIDSKTGIRYGKPIQGVNR